MAYDGNKLSKLEALKLLAERTKLETEKGIKAAIAEAGHAKFEKVDTLPEIADAQENVMYLLLNTETNHYDIYAKIGEKLEQLDDTSVNLEDYVLKEEGKELIEGYFELYPGVKNDMEESVEKARKKEYVEQSWAGDAICVI